MARTLEIVIGLGAVAAAAAAATWAALRSSRGRELGDIDGRRESAIAMPDRWWLKRAPHDGKVCYRTKTDALNVFREYNQRVIDDYGGETAQHRSSEFDAINHRHGLTGKQKATTIAQALWLSMPPQGRGPYCVDDIDVDLLNETSPGRNHPVGFMLPDYVEEARLIEAEQEYWAQTAGPQRARVRP